MAASKNRKAFDNAFWMGEFSTLETVYASGDIDLNQPQDDSGFTWLQSACRAGRIDIVRWMLAEGADANAEAGPDEYGDSENLGATALMLLADSIGGKPLDIMAVLLESGADINHADSLGQNVVHRSLQSAQFLDAVLTLGADPNVVANDGETPLMRALHWGDDGIIARLKAAGAQAGDTTGLDFLQAVVEGNVPRVRELLAAGANVNYQCDGTAASSAIDRGDLEMLKLLIEAGGDINLADTDDPEGDFNPLLRASYAGDVDMVRFLLDQGASLDVSNGGISPLDYAKTGKAEGHNPDRPWNEVIKLLRSAAGDKAATLRGEPVKGSAVQVLETLASLIPEPLGWSRFAGGGVDILESDALVGTSSLAKQLPALQHAARSLGYSLIVAGFSLKDAEPTLSEVRSALAKADGLTADDLFDAWENERRGDAAEPDEDPVDNDWSARLKRFASLGAVPRRSENSEYRMPDGCRFALSKSPRSLPIAYRFGGWNSAPLPAEIGVVAAHWLKCYGAELLAIDRTSLIFDLPAPLADKEQMQTAAREIALFCDELEAGDEVRTASRRQWSFWWD